MDIWKTSTNWKLFVVAILKFSVFSACKSVHRAELFKQIDLLWIMFFYWFFDDFRREIDKWPGKNVYFAKLWKFKDNDIHQSNKKFSLK